jgi:AcrR family transcriptional regulator
VSTPRVLAADARLRILEATRELLLERPFAALTVGAIMDRAGLARTIFYRHFESIPELAPELLPDSASPLVERVTRMREDEVVAALIDGQVELYAEHGRLLRAIDDAARHDPDVAAELDRALVAPRRLLTRLLAGARHPPPDPGESARLLMATHRAYLLDTFGEGGDTPRRRATARAALKALWERLLE